MVEEKRELDVKIDSLQGWINNKSTFEALDDDEQIDQKQQLHHMLAYSNVLGSRLRRHETPRRK